MGQKLTGIVIQKSLNDSEVLSLLEINESEIIKREKSNFENITEEFCADKNLGICATRKGTFISCSVKLITDYKKLSLLSLKHTIIAFYCYDTTSTYCIDIFEEGVHKTHLWSSSDKTFNLDEIYYGYDEELNTPNKVNNHILKLIKNTTGISFNVDDNNRESTFIGYKPEYYLEIPLLKKQVEAYILKKLDDFFTPIGFKYFKTSGEYRFNNKLYELKFNLGIIKETIESRENQNWGIEFNPHIEFINKNLKKRVSKIDNSSTPSMLISLYNLFTESNNYSFKKYFIASKEDLDELLDKITSPVETNKIFELSEKYKSVDNIIELFAKYGVKGHKYLSDFKPNRLKQGLTIAKLIEDQDLIDKFEYELI